MIWKKRITLTKFIKKYFYWTKNNYIQLYNNIYFSKVHKINCIAFIADVIGLSVN